MVATTSERLFTHFAMCRANQAEGTAVKCVYPSYFTATRTAVVVWRGCYNDYSSKAVLLLSQLWGNSKTCGKMGTVSNGNRFYRNISMLHRI